MKIKKPTPIVLSSLLLMSVFAGCAQNSNGSSGENSTLSSSQTSASDSESIPEPSETESTETSESKVLVVYYSATGNTENVANNIADAMNADIFEIVPSTPYTDADLNWTNEDSRVSVEHNNPDQRNVPLVSTTVESWDSYDTVYIGYPIWWGIAAWPVDSFIAANDFTGKTVIPFATAASSGMGQSGELLSEFAGTGNWGDGECFRSGSSDEDIIEWAKEAAN